MALSVVESDDLVDVLFVVYFLLLLSILPLYLMLLLLWLLTFFIHSPFDVLNPFLWTFYPFDVVHVRFGANLFVLAQIDLLVVVDV